MSYLLDRWQDWPKNIILPEVAQFIQAEQSRRSQKKESFPLHKYIHHGLSSQAMVFNLVGPFVVQNNLIPLRAAFEVAQTDWTQEVTAIRNASIENVTLMVSLAQIIMLLYDFHI